MMYSLDEIGILPSSKATDITSRSECSPLGDLGTYPIFVSPMTSVIDESNYQLFTKADVFPIIPRRIDNLQFRLNACNHVWCAFSLKEFETFFCEGEVADECPLVLIDLANGHMKKIYELVKKAKERWGTIIIMVGNIAHPDLYWECYDAGVDYVRVGIGTGSVCTTGVKTGIHASMEWLLRHLSNCKSMIKDSPKPKKAPKIIADGGIKYSGDMTKAIAAGANVCMMGSIFAGCDESPGTFELFQGRKYKVYRGMGSIAAMENGSKDRYFQTDAKKLVPEGVEGRVAYKGSVEDTVFQLMGGLRSGMGYCGAATIEDLKQTGKFVKISSASLKESHPHDIHITKEAPNYSVDE